jgi:hypothetical protein
MVVAVSFHPPLTHAQDDQKNRQKAHRTAPPPDWDDSLFVTAQRARLAAPLVNEHDSIASKAAFINPVGAGTINNRAGTLRLGASAASVRTLPPGTINDDWVGPATGVWSNPSNWNGGVPNNGGGNIYNVFIDNGNPQSTTVTTDISPTINNLTIDSDDALIIGNNTSLTVNGNISNAGTLSLNSAGNSTQLIIGSSNVTLSGGGTLTMSNNSNNIITGSVGTNTLTNQETIQGSGNIGNSQMALINSGTIDANQSAGTLTLQISNGVTNTGTLEATNGATLVITGVTNGGVNVMNKGGTIQAVGAGSIVSLENAIIAGGTLTTSGGGVIQTPFGYTAALDGSTSMVTNSGTFSLNNESFVQLIGTINNTGSIQLNSTGNSTAILIGNGNVTLTGGGTLTMSNNTFANGISGFRGATFTNVNNTISGAGTIGEGDISLVNQASGIIDANQSNALVIQTRNGTNTGTLEATNGATLVLSSRYTGGVITNTGGTIQAVGAGSFVALESGLTITKGMLTTSGGGVIETQGGQTATLNGVTNSGNYTVSDNSTTFLAGTITQVGAGTINVVSTGDSTFLKVTGNVGLKGGTVILGDNPNNIIEGVSTGNEVLMSSATIEGAGNIGNNLMGLVNTGTILANDSNPLTIQPDAKNFKNSGKLIVSSGSAMDIIGPTATSFITTGTVVINGGGSLTVGGSATYSQTGTKLASTTVDGTLTSANGISIAGGTVFGNMGTLIGNFNLSGTAAISPGDGIKKVGELTINGTYAQASTASALIDLGGLSSGAFDVVNITNAASLNGKLIVDLVNGFNPVAGDNFDIMNYASESGAFSSETLPTISGDHWLVTIGATDVLLQLLAGTGPTRELRTSSAHADLGGAFGQATDYAGYVPPSALPPTSQFDDSGFSNSDGQPTQTPEPSSLLLLASSFLGYATWARRRIRKTVTGR